MDHYMNEYESGYNAHQSIPKFSNFIHNLGQLRI